MIKIFLLLLAFAIAQENFWIEADEVLSLGRNTPEQAAIKARSLGGIYKPWACNQYINYCYFNDINQGGNVDYYASWPKVGNFGRSGTVITGISDAGTKHVGIFCNGSIFCHEPNNSGKAITCKEASYFKYVFKSYTLHLPP